MNAQSSQGFDVVDNLYKKGKPQKSRTVQSCLYTPLAVLLLAFSLVFFFSAGFGMRNVAPKDKLEDYNSAEARGIATYINQTQTPDQCTQTVLKYHVLDEADLYTLSEGQDLSILKKSIVGHLKENVSGGLGVVSIIEPQGR